jgi:outer membrane protein
MKKAIVILALTATIFSCQKATETKEFKTAYVDTMELLKNYDEAKDIETKYKEKAKTMGTDLQAEIAKFQQEAQNFQANAQKNGQAWAQKKGAELQQKEQQLTYAQQAIQRQLEEESGKEMDSLKSNLKKFIKDYGKKNGYTYIYGTGEVATVLYAEDKLDITKEMIKLINENYKSKPKTTEKEAVKPDSTEAAK